MFKIMGGDWRWGLGFRQFPHHMRHLFSIGQPIWSERLMRLQMRPQDWVWRRRACTSNSRAPRPASMDSGAYNGPRPALYTTPQTLVPPSLNLSENASTRRQLCRQCKAVVNWGISRSRYLLDWTNQKLNQSANAELRWISVNLQKRTKHDRGYFDTKCVPRPLTSKIDLPLMLWTS